MPEKKPTDAVMDESTKDNITNDVDMDDANKPSEKGVAATETLVLKYDDEDGSLAKDKGLKTHLIPDDDKRWWLLDTSGGLKKLLLKEGTADEPSKGDKVACHYSGFLRSNGDMFDSSRERGELFKFEIGKGSVIKGWDMGIATMKVGERAILRCRADFAYGEKGSPPKIPANATLDFIVQLKEIQQYEFLYNTDDAKNSIAKRTMEKVDGWETAEKLWGVTVTYTGREIDETGRIWCSGKDQKFKMPFDLEFEGKGVIPDYELPRGFYVCLKNTKKDELNYFKLKSNEFYTFGTAGSEKFGIAPNTDLFFEMKVTDFDKFDISPWKVDSKDKIPRAMELKDIANNFFRRKKLAVAKEVYSDIINITKDMKDKDADEAKSITITCYSNCALVETQLNNFSEAAEQIEKGLEIDSKHQKLRYRKAFLFFKQGDFFAAEQLLDNLIKEYPDNKALKTLARKNARATKDSEKKARKLARKMFGPRAAKKINEEEQRAASDTKNKPAGGLKTEKNSETAKLTTKNGDSANVKDVEAGAPDQETKAVPVETKPTD